MLDARCSMFDARAACRVATCGELRSRYVHACVPHPHPHHTVPVLVRSPARYASLTCQLPVASCQLPVARGPCVVSIVRNQTLTSDALALALHSDLGPDLCGTGLSAVDKRECRMSTPRRMHRAALITPTSVSASASLSGTSCHLSTYSSAILDPHIG